MTRGRKSTQQEDPEEIRDEVFEEELYGRKIICTCKDDPDYCEKHGGFWY